MQCQCREHGYRSSAYTSWCTRYGQAIADWIGQELLNLECEVNHECGDNWRVAEISNSDEMSEYDRQQLHGCCGSVDREITHETGRKFAIGLNYGH